MICFPDRAVQLFWVCAGFLRPAFRIMPTMNVGRGPGFGFWHLMSEASIVAVWFSIPYHVISRDLLQMLPGLVPTLKLYISG